jgi:hypothetical protein
LLSVKALDHGNSMASHGHQLMISRPNARSTRQTQSENFTGSNVTHVVRFWKLRDAEISIRQNHG